MKTEETEIRELLKKYYLTGDSRIREEVINKNLNIVKNLAKKFSPNSVLYEDIYQIALVGLISAVDRFNPSKGENFQAYAIATIVGEIKKYFRDKTWKLKVPRTLKEINVSMKVVIEKLYKKEGRYPTYNEIADEMNVTIEDLIEAQEAKDSCKTIALSESFEGDESHINLMDHIGKEDKEIAIIGDKLALNAAIESLPEEEKMIIKLRYFESYHQREIAKVLNMSQGSISKLLSKAIQKLKKKINEA